MNNGINGGNTRTLNGFSRDMIMQAVGGIGGAYLLIQDDPDLIPMARARGFRTIYRQSGDDPGHNPLPASNKSEDIKRAAEAFTVERGKKGADVLHLTNELQTSPKLHEFTRYCLEKSYAEGWTAVAYNYGTHTRMREYVDAFDNLVYIASHEQILGAHLYPDYRHDATVAEWIELIEELHVPTIATEFNWTLSYTDPYHGWRNVPEAVYRPLGYATVEAFRAGFIAKWSAWLAAHNIPACWFGVDYWNEPTLEAAKAYGYGWGDLPDVIAAFTLNNQTHKFKEQPMVYIPDNKGQGEAATIMTRLNLRGDRAGAYLTTMEAGESVVLFPDTIDKVDGSKYDWGFIQRADLAHPFGWAAPHSLTGEVWISPVEPPLEDEPPVTLISAPYVSQSGVGASRYGNDCGVAAALILLKWKWQTLGLSPADYPTADDASVHTSLSSKDDGLTLQELVTLLAGYGLAAFIHDQLDAALLKNFLDAGHPVLVLLNYGLFYPPDSFDGGHFAVVIGYTEHHFICHDPYHAGQDYQLPFAQLEAAMKDVLNYAREPSRGIVTGDG